MQLELDRTGRARILAYACLGIMAVFIVRLFYLQVVQHSHYVALAQQEQLKRLVLPAKRGEIYAMDGPSPVKLVLNEVVYTVFVDPKIVDEPTKVTELIRRVAGGNAQSNLKELLAQRESRYQIVAKGVSRQQAEMMKQAELRGLGFQEESQRVYPEGRLAAQTLGFVNNEGEGQYGVEGKLNDRLTGQDGLLQSVTDVRDVPLTIGGNNINMPAKNGEDIALTIDRNIQSYTESALADGLKRTGATHGSVIVMDPHTGKVLAMANLPTFNPAEFNKVTNSDVFNNAVVSAPYEPGSVMKAFTVAMGIDKGVITPQSTYNNTDYIKVGDTTITNASKGHTGVTTMQEALDNSLNTGMVTIARRLGNGTDITRSARDTMYDYLHNKFGLGVPTGIEVSGEAAGRIIAPDKQEGNAVRYSNMSFGQGMDLTMVQVAAGFGAIINGGTYYHPTVLEGTVNSEGELQKHALRVPQRGVISVATSDATKQMLHDARTAFYGSQDRPGYYVGGKTGTSQTIANGKYVFNQTTGTYIGYGGDDKQARYVIMVQVAGKNMKMEGNTHAMPIFTDISNWLLDYMKVAPKG